MQKYNVMFAIEDLGIGGAERVVFSLARGLDRTHFRVHVTCLRKPGALARDLDEHVDGLYVLGKRGKIDLAMLNRFVNLLRGKRIDVLNTHLVTANTWGRIAARLAGTPVVIATEHSADAWKGPVLKTIDRILVRLSDRVVAVSNGVKDFYTKTVGLPGHKIEVIHNGIDAASWKRPGCRNKTRTSLGIRPDALVIGTIGRLIEDKAHLDLLRAAVLVEDVEVVIAGSGPMMETLRRKARELGIADRTHLLGTRSDVREILEALEVFVLPSKREGFPVCVLEAFAVGVPVVATRVGGVGEVVTAGESGLLVPYGDVPALASAIERTLGDSDLVLDLTVNARRLVEKRFTEASMVRQTGDLFMRLLLEKGVTGR